MLPFYLFIAGNLLVIIGLLYLYVVDVRRVYLWLLCSEVNRQFEKKINKINEYTPTGKVIEVPPHEEK